MRIHRLRHDLILWSYCKLPSQHASVANTGIEDGIARQLSSARCELLAYSDSVAASFEHYALG